MIPDDPTRLFESGRAANVPFLAGTNHDEGTINLGLSPVNNLSEYRTYLAKPFGSSADAAFDLYPAATDAEARASDVCVSGDLVIVYGTRAVVRAMTRRNPRAYLYSFARENKIGRNIRRGVFHISEIGYVFRNLLDSAYGTGRMTFGDFSVKADSYDDQDEVLSIAMSAAWIRFARMGDPNGSGFPTWPACSEPTEPYLEFRDAIQARAGLDSLRAKELDFVAGFCAGLRARNPVAADRPSGH